MNSAYDKDEEELKQLLGLSSTVLKSIVRRTLLNGQSTYDQKKFEEIKQAFRGKKGTNKNQDATLNERSLENWDITLLCKVLSSKLCGDAIDRAAVDNIRQVRNDYSHIAEDRRADVGRRCRALCFILKGTLLFYDLCREDEFPPPGDEGVSVAIDKLPTIEQVVSRTEGPIWIDRWKPSFTPGLVALVKQRIREQDGKGKYLHIELSDLRSYVGREIHPRLDAEWLGRDTLCRFCPEWQEKLGRWLNESERPVRDAKPGKYSRSCIVLSTLSRHVGKDIEALQIAYDLTHVSVEDHMVAFEGRAQNRDDERLLPPFEGSTSSEAWQYLHDLGDSDTKTTSKDFAVRTYSDHWEHIFMYWREPPTITWLFESHSYSLKHEIEGHARKFNPQAYVSNLSMKMYLVMEKKYRLAYCPNETQPNSVLQVNIAFRNRPRRF